MEASFASKLVASIDPDQPVIDSLVLKNLGLRLPPKTSHDRFSRIVDLHRDLAEWYHAQLASLEGVRALERFRKAYPDARITDMKALDLIIWKVRDAG